MLLITENIIQIIFLILSLSVNSRRRACLHHSNTPHQKHGMSQSVTNAGETESIDIYMSMGRRPMTCWNVTCVAAILSGSRHSTLAPESIGVNEERATMSVFLQLTVAITGAV